MHHNRDPHGHSEEKKARHRGGSTHRKMLRTGGACERARGGSIPGEAKIEAEERKDDEEPRNRGGKVHGDKPKKRLDKHMRANGGALGAPSAPVGRKDGGRMTPKSPFTRTPKSPFTMTPKSPFTMTPKSPFTGAGGHKPPFPHSEMPVDEGGEGKVSQRKHGGHVKKRADGGAMGPMSGAGMKRGGHKRAAGGAVPGRKRGGRMEHDDGPDAIEGERAGAPAKSRTGGDPVSGANRGGRLTAHERQRMPKSDFALPGKGAGPKGAGAGSYPINDASHATNALARVAQHGSPGEQATVRRKVHEKFPGID